MNIINFTAKRIMHTLIITKYKFPVYSNPSNSILISKPLTMLMMRVSFFKASINHLKVVIKMNLTFSFMIRT